MMKLHIDPEYIELSRKMSAKAAAREKKRRRSAWWKSNWIGLAGLLVAVVGVVLSVILTR